MVAWSPLRELGHEFSEYSFLVEYTNSINNFLYSKALGLGNSSHYNQCFTRPEIHLIFQAF
jgi:hypothetical protein